MRVEQAMSTPAVTVTAATSVKQAAGLLAARGFTVLPVVDADLRLVGIVSEGDLVRDRFPAEARLGVTLVEALPALTIAEVMTREVLTAAVRDDVHELIERMRLARVRAVPVCRDGLVVGVVTYRDLLRTVAREDGRIAAAARARLESVFSLGRFTVTARDGVVTLIDRMARPEDWHTARVLAEQVPGAARASVTSPVDEPAG